MPELNVSRRDSLRNLAALGLAGAAVAAGVAATTSPADAAQPAMRGALNDLESALNALQHGRPDKAGHRVKAIALVREAIGEVQKGIVAGAL